MSASAAAAAVVTRRRSSGRSSSPLRAWDRNSWVRSKPRRAPEFSDDLDYFPAGLTPLLGLPLDDVGLSRRAVGVHQLYAYLRLTVAIELHVVNRAMLLVHEHRMPFAVDEELARDTLRVYTDEGGHAEMCSSLASAVQAKTGVAAVAYEPSFLRRLRVLEAARSVDLASELFAFLAAVVTETLVTQALTSIPTDPTVQEPVRAVVADHAADERTHFSLFRKLYFRVWDQLSDAQRRTVGRLVPAMVVVFTDPDLAPILTLLDDARLSPRRRTKCIDAVACDPSVEARRRRAAAHIVRMFAESGAFDDDVVVQAFAAKGLLP